MDSLRSILEKPHLTDKFTPIEMDLEKIVRPSQSKKILSPARSKKLGFSQEQIKFPKVGSLVNEQKRALALHFFANHELLALEIFVQFYLVYLAPQEGQRELKVHILQTIKEEQKHLKLYVERLQEMGVEFGDYPLNDFFWRQFQSVQSQDQFFAMMSLTFEVANLDFAHFYSKIFRNFEDEKSAKIMDIVLKDELRHVGIGVKQLRKDTNNELWDTYLACLPESLNPMRGKGHDPSYSLRQKAGLDDNFIKKQLDYMTEFRVLNRNNKYDKKLL